MDITLYNTRTRRKERLDPVTPGKASMYVCGPTVYDRAHIGNARPVVVFDVLFRLLRRVYGEGAVTYVRNITDVDDKIIARARESGREIGAITAETTRWFHEDMDALGALRPSFEPRATEHIGEMIAMIALLIERGHAYAAEGHVLFAVASYPDYGRLARRTLEDMRAGARVDVAPYKRGPMDFVLWKPSDAETPGWDSPWGRGRPGWHIECSAMARALLGAEFDIHGGGVDLAFPHHENELAQSVCAHPDEGFARVWMHNGMLNVEGEKMSKSLGNFFTVRDLRRRIPGMVIRHVLLSTHYRSPLDWTEARVSEATALLNFWHRVSATALRKGLESSTDPSPDGELLERLADDLDTPGALQRLHRLAENARPGSNTDAMRSFLNGVDLFGFQPAGTAGKDVSASVERAFDQVDRAWASLDAKAAELHAARMRKDYATADRIRAELEALGVAVQSTAEGTTWTPTVAFDARKVEALKP